VKIGSGSVKLLTSFGIVQPVLLQKSTRFHDKNTTGFT